MPITSPLLYSAGHTDDTRQALMYIAHEFPDAPLLGLGFSLGANVLTRYLGEEGKLSRVHSAVMLGCVRHFSVFFLYSARLNRVCLLSLGICSKIIMGMFACLLAPYSH